MPYWGIPPLPLSCFLPKSISGYPPSCPNPLSFGWLSSIVFGSPIFSVALWHCVQIPYHFGGSPTSCLNPLYFQQLSDLVHILYLFGNSLTSCPDPLLSQQLFGIMSGPLSFRWLFDIVSRSPIYSIAIRHCIWIPFLFHGSLTSCPDPLSFRRFSNIMSRSPIFSTTLWHHVWIPYLFCGAPASCLDPLSFWRLLDIMSRSPIFFVALWHRVWIPGIVSRSPIFLATLRHHVLSPYHFGNSSELCLDPLVLNHCDPSPLAFGIVVWGQNCWPLIFLLELISTHSPLALYDFEPLIHSLY